MLIDPVPFEKVWRTLHGSTPFHEGIVRFVKFLERKLGGRFVYDKSALPLGREDLSDLFEIAERLRRGGTIKSYQLSRRISDEPPICAWGVDCGTADSHIAGGLSVEDDRAALIPALAESVERGIWFESTDYFRNPTSATSSQIAAKGAAIMPKHFAGYSPSQRTAHERLRLPPEAQYLWIQAYSHIQKKDVWVPAQAVSGAHGGRIFRDKSEPIIVLPVTNGLATGPTREFALLNGALEIIERDAYMIMWTNQLSLPRLDLSRLSKEESLDALSDGAATRDIAKILSLCKRYRLSASAVQLITDAPTHAICALVHDESKEGLAVSIGLKAHRSLPHALRGALLEALRIRRSVRWKQQNEYVDPKKVQKQNITYLDRAIYWEPQDRREKLAFLDKGPLVEPEKQLWESDSLEEHLARIIRWCHEKKYEFASVDMSSSKRNLSPWKIEMAVMPDLQPMHLIERYAYGGGKRLSEIPQLFGYEPRKEPYLDEPHPFV